ncbi:hypothetical protein PIB30_005973 [Stylosanthes scabra]|uniref:Uncharacterized protein n=1 Tax=Stylosanthes scabra TaxID=79078 RepID=A0ABU6S3P1_9FABA|nr:hypothetical protein [Stylosanthes scabra]
MVLKNVKEIATIVALVAHSHLNLNNLPSNVSLHIEDISLNSFTTFRVFVHHTAAQTARLAARTTLSRSSRTSHKYSLKPDQLTIGSDTTCWATVGSKTVEERL